MSTIFIDTDELRDIARDLRGVTARMGDARADLGRVWSTDIGPPAPAYIGRVTGEQAAIAALATKVTVHAGTLDAEAVAREAAEAIGGVVASLTGLGAVFLRVAWTSSKGEAPPLQVPMVASFLDGLDTLVDATDAAIAWLRGAKDRVVSWLSEAVEELLDVLTDVISTAGRMMSAALATIASTLRSIEATTLAMALLALTFVTSSLLFPFILSGAASQYGYVAVRFRDGETYVSTVDGPSTSDISDPGAHLLSVRNLKADRITLLKVSDDPPRYVLHLRGIDPAFTDDPHRINSYAVAQYEYLHGDGPYTRAVLEVLRKQGLPPNAELMIIGHSQGGIVAQNIASLQAYNVTHVVAAGAPMRDPGPSTRVLVVQNTRDQVANAMGLRTPIDQAIARDPNVQVHSFTGPSLNPLDAHEVRGSGNYAEVLSGLKHDSRYSGFFDGASQFLRDEAPLETKHFGIGY